METEGNYPGYSSGCKPKVTEAAQVFETKEDPESTEASAAAGGMETVPTKVAEAPQAPEARRGYKTWYFAEAIDCELDPCGHLFQMMSSTSLCSPTLLCVVVCVICCFFQ